MRNVFVASALITLAACASPSVAPRLLDVAEQNESGVTGSVTLTASGEDRTVVEVAVDPAGHPDMPAHVHAGQCDDLVPQPMFPLENVRNGTSRTEIPVALAELLDDTVAINLHHSNEQMEVSVACVNLGPS